MPITHTAGATTFDGPAAVNVFRMAAIASALRLYAKTGMKVNRAYTPKAMMAAAEQLTGRKFPARAYLEAAEALTAASRAAAAAA